MPADLKSPSSTKETSRFVSRGILEVKEDSESLIVKGFIATTHLDNGWMSEDGKMIRDKISRDTLVDWAKEINEGNPRANKVSVNHDRIPHVAGLGIPGTAKVVQFRDGEYGLYVETKIDKTRADYEELKYRVKEGFLDSFSIEFTAADNSPIVDGIRTLVKGAQLFGWTLASQPMNEYAVMLKEYYRSQSNINVEAEKQLDLIGQRTVAPAVDIELKTSTEAMKMETKTETTAPAPEVKTQPQEIKTEVKPEVKPVEIKQDDIVKSVLESKELKEKIDKMIADKPKLNETKESEVKVEVKEYREIFSEKGKNISIKEQFVRAGKLADSLGLTSNGIKHNTAAETRQYKNFSTNGSKLQFKGLGIGTNINAAYIDDTSSVGISTAELQDVFDPIIYNALNEETVLWNVLQKDNKAGSGSNRVEFVLKIAQNTSAGAYAGNDIGTGYTSREKFITKFKKYKADFAVDGDMIAAARGGPIGDILALEIEDATLALLSAINSALFAEVGLETATGVIGLEYVTDSAGNTSLYGVTRSSTNKLAPDSATDTYYTGASGNYKSLLRQAIRTLLKDGSRKQDLLFVTAHVQGDKIKETFDNQQRLMAPTATRFGFETDLFFEGTPILLDKDCNTDDIWLIDTRAHRIAMFVPPTVEMLGKRSDAEEGFIKTYFAVYNTAPRRMIQIYSCPTS